jgi:hypothetical protein
MPGYERPVRLTDAEWDAICSAVAAHEFALQVQEDDHGERTQRERDALNRAFTKIRHGLRPRRQVQGTRARRGAWTR